MTVAAPDRAPESLAGGAEQPLRGELEALLGADRVLGRAGDIVRYASDASPYRLLPRAVVVAHDADDVAKTLAYGRENGVPVVFRAGGTSLNGQGQGDGILVDVRRHFRGVAVEDGGALARVKPGVVLGHANRVLAPHGRKLGPDPASSEIATVGGVIANNSGGMRCGTTHDSYSTVRSLTFVLPSGTMIDTAEPGAAEKAFFTSMDESGSRVMGKGGAPAKAPAAAPAAPAKKRRLSEIAGGSSFATHQGLPTFKDSSRASSSACSSTRSASASSSSIRSFGVFDRHSDHAFFAESTARSTSSAELRGTSAIASPVAGFSTSIVSPLADSTHSPPMNCLCRVTDTLTADLRLGGCA